MSHRSEGGWYEERADVCGERMIREEQEPVV